MGTKMAVSFANIFMAEVETEIINRRHLQVAEHSFWYLCFIHLFLYNPWSFGRQKWQQAS